MGKGVRGVRNRPLAIVKIFFFGGGDFPLNILQNKFLNYEIALFFYNSWYVKVVRFHLFEIIMEFCEKDAATGHSP